MFNAGFIVYRGKTSFCVPVKIVHTPWYKKWAGGHMLGRVMRSLELACPFVNIAQDPRMPSVGVFCRHTRGRCLRFCQGASPLTCSRAVLVLCWQDIFVEKTFVGPVPKHVVVLGRVGFDLFPALSAAGRILRSGDRHQ